jgi:glycosyltransferase involved in cell wall biosynthesis
MNLEQIRVMMIIGRMGDGGKERQLLLLLKTLKQHQEIFTILMVMNAGGEREMEASQFADKLVVLSGRSKIDLISPVIKLCKLIKNENIGLIHTWGSGIWDLIGLIGGRLCHIPVLHNGIRSAPDQMNIYNHVTRISARFADAAVANSKAGLTAFDLTDHPHAKVIYNGLDPSRFEGVRIVDEGQNLCMVANFREGKDHHCLILAMPEILKRFPQASLTLVGHDYGTLIETQNLVNKLQISKNVGFVTDCTRPEPIIGKSQIGILATNVSAHGEGIYNALLEYMALSKPVIATDNGGNPEVVFDNGTGFLVPPGSHEAISEKVIYLLEKPSIAKEMGKRGKSSVNERFSLEKMEKDYIELYSALSQVPNSGR